MAGPALTAQVFVACQNVQWDGPAGPTTTRTLEQVGYIYHTETPDGFPYETDLWLFVRLAARRRRPFTRDLRLTLIWLDDPRRRPVVWNRSFMTVTFRPTAPVRDVAVTTAQVFEGPGRYEFRLWYSVVRKWDGAQRQRTLSRTFVRIEG